MPQLSASAINLLNAGLTSGTGTEVANIATGAVGNGSAQLASMLNTFAGNSANALTIGKAGGGTFTQESNGNITITVDPDQIPASDATASQWDTFADLLGHELGHATQTGGSSHRRDATIC